MKFYRAPWGKTLWFVSVLLTLVCLGFALWPWFPHLKTPEILRVFGALYVGIRVLLLATIVGGILFAVRGYTITGDAVLVHRWGWRALRIPLVNLRSAQVQPRAMKNALRWFGNGGLYSFTGFYYNTSLGNFRAFVTDARRTVVLRLAKRTFVFSPDEPDAFVQQLVASCH